MGKDIVMCVSRFKYVVNTTNWCWINEDVKHRMPEWDALNEERHQELFVTSKYLQTQGQVFKGAREKGRRKCYKTNVW